ncbi:MAG TPA: hypothetical protein DCS93_02505 [Microscillaceae bacterium]|nr:hypothetical protein [Microscillaceae bacterium]
MFKSYFKRTVRHLLRDKLYTLLNIGSLALGLACFIWIWLYIKHEQGYDQYATQSEQIYRVVTDFETSTGTSNYATSAPLWGPYLQQDYPEVTKAVRLKPLEQKMMVSSGQQRFYETQWAFADPDFFQMFSLPLLQGNRTTALQQKHQVVITQRMAQKYFGGGSPLGKQLTLDNRQTFTVSGVMADFPKQSHFHFDFIASFSSTPQIFGDNFIKHKRNLWVHTYLQLRSQTNKKILEARLPSFIDKYVGSQKHNGFKLTAYLQPLTSIHLASHRLQEIEANTQQSTLYILWIIGGFVLLIAITNYVNLATARAARRAKEVGITKVIGGHRTQLMIQFLSEAIMLTFLALVLAGVVLEISTPLLTKLSGSVLSLRDLLTPAMVWQLLLLTLGVGVLAGAYPALVLAGFDPVKALKGQLLNRRKGMGLRKTLIITQFTVSITLMVATVAVYKQLTYMQNKSLGFDQEQIVLVDFPNRATRKNYKVYKNEILKNAAITRVSGTSDAPGISTNEHVFRAIGQGIAHDRVVHRAFVDYDYFKTLEVPIIAGRAFSKKFPKDTLSEKLGSTIVINETAVKAFGWKTASEAIGQKLRRVELSKSKYEIVGVVKDFHTESMHQKIQPTLFNYAPARRQSQMLVKYQGVATQEVLSGLQQSWQKINPAYNFAYSFVDQNFAKFYTHEVRLGKLMGGLAVMAIIVACMGVFGLSAYLAQQRQKEISVRKVLGASIPHLWYIFARQFIYLIIIAGILATPLTWFFTHNWLQNFAYRTLPSAGEFALMGMITLIVALGTISFHTIHIARANPVKVLRNE